MDADSEIEQRKQSEPGLPFQSVALTLGTELLRMTQVFAHYNSPRVNRQKERGVDDLSVVPSDTIDHRGRAMAVTRGMSGQRGSEDAACRSRAGPVYASCWSRASPVSAPCRPRVSSVSAPCRPVSVPCRPRVSSVSAPCWFRVGPVSVSCQFRAGPMSVRVDPVSVPCRYVPNSLLSSVVPRTHTQTSDSGRRPGSGALDENKCT